MHACMITSACVALPTFLLSRDDILGDVAFPKRAKYLFTTMTLDLGCFWKEFEGSTDLFLFQNNSGASETMHLLSDCIYSKPCLACYFTGVFWPEARGAKRTV